MLTRDEFLSGMQIMSDVSIVLTDVINGGEDGFLEYEMRTPDGEMKYIRVNIESISKEEFENEQTEGEQNEMHDS